MSPERVATFVVCWARLYTSGLARSVANRRTEEIESDLHHQIAHERSLGVADRRITARIVSRMIRGFPADLAWRGHEIRQARTHSTRGSNMDTVTLGRSALRVGVFVVAVLMVPLVGTMVSDEWVWSVGDFVLCGILLAIIGVCVDVAVRRRGSLLIGCAAAALGVAAIVVGQLDDAPGLMLLGALMVAGGGAVAYRRTQPAH